MTKLLENDSITQPGVISSAEILCEGITRRFLKDSRPAVNQISFRVAAGDLVVLLGPSGCGKTTLLKMINRLIEPDEGRIWIGADEIHTLPVNHLRRQIGYVIQQVGLFPHMTIQDNIAVVPSLLGWPKEKIVERAMELMKLVGLPQHYLQRYPRQLSGGEQQRVGLARALAADPAILLMDEPFAAVDAINRERLQGELLEIHRKLHKTILFVTHDVEEAFRLADKILILQAGKFVQYGTPVEIITQPASPFVEELIGSQNMMRRLSLFTVADLLQGRNPVKKTSLSHESAGDAEPNEVSITDDLRTVLSALLHSSQNELIVRDNRSEVIARIGFEDLRSLLADQRAAFNEEG